MSIPVGESIGLEVAFEHRPVPRVDAGEGRCVMGRRRTELTFEEQVSDGWSIQVPAGTWHDVVNTGDEPLRLYAIYAPAHTRPASPSLRRTTPSMTNRPASMSRLPGLCSMRKVPPTSTPGH